MKDTTFKNRKLISLFSSITITIILSVLLSAIYFIDRINSFSNAYVGAGFFEMVSYVVFLCLTILLLVTYRRWRLALKREKDLEEIIFDVNPDLVMVIDSENKIIWCNDSVQNLLGYRAEEVINQNANRFVGKRDPQQVVESVSPDNPTKNIKRIGMTTGIKKSGHKIPLEIIVSQPRNRTDKVVLLRDVSEQKKAEVKINELNQELARLEENHKADLKKAYEDLNGLNTLKDAFFASLTQEFKAPLTSIRSTSHLLIDNRSRDINTFNDYLSLINKEAVGLMKLIDTVLDPTKFSESNIDLIFHDLEVKSVVSKCVESKRKMLTEKKLTIDIKIEKNLPKFCGDEVRIHQVLTNLLDNAIKFTSPEGSIHIEGKLLDKKRNEDSSDFIHIFVSDTGSGSAPEILPVLFDRFKPANDDMADLPMGDGLGLSICKDIIDYHGGKIWADSTVGKGSRFHIILPLKFPFHTAQNQAASGLRT